ncbi:MAG: amidohydrolase family protein, partial [Clostridia bacterium]|nr:amidohydrolase family protein [Clostridia bacterium]
AFDDTPFLQNRNHLEEEEMYKKYHGAENGRIKIDKSCHSIYTSNLKTVEALAEFAKENDRIVHIHLSETKTEVDEAIEKYGKSPVKYFYDAGLLDSHTVAAHSVWLSDEDIQIMAETKTVAAHNPVSNLKLASGVANIPKMTEAGVIVALGTDGCSSNNNLDMIEEIKFAAILNKGERLNPLATPTSEVLSFATKNGAYAQRRADCGAIKVGNKADLIVIDANKPSMQPVFDCVNNVVYSANGSDVELTMIDGKTVYEKGEFKTIDVEKAIYMVNKSAKRIVEELKA